MKDLPIIFNAAKERGLSDVNCDYLALACMNQMPGSVHSGMFVNGNRRPTQIIPLESKKL